MQKMMLTEPMTESNANNDTDICTANGNKIIYDHYIMFELIL